MSNWTYVKGSIEVDVPGRSQPEIEYILKSILSHLPRVTGSESDMRIYINKCNGENTSSSHDEYGMRTKNLVDEGGWLRTQSIYMLTLDGSLRDRVFNETFREFMKWLCRLSKRLSVNSILVRIDDYDKSYVINENWDSAYEKMYEYPSWSSDDHEPAWWEHLMWDRYKDTSLPLSLIYKYFNDRDADEEFERRFKND